MSSTQNTWSPDRGDAIHVAPTQGPPTSIDTASAEAQIRTASHLSSTGDLLDSQQATYAGPGGSASDSMANSQTLGCYRIEEQVAAGACGVLYRAVDQRLNRTVAIKVLHGDHAESKVARKRIEQEAMAAAAVGHESIVTVFDVSFETGQPPFLVMEFVEGSTLRQHMPPAGTISIQQAAKYILQIAGGLGAAHEKQLVHRDIKPSNILIEERSNRAKITDFGLARAATDEMRLTSDNIIAGTPAYMSPEQVVTPGEVGPPTDIYSTGVVLYELLTGKLPFEGPIRQILTRVLHEQPQPIRELNPQTPAALEAICMKAMAKDPQDRYGSGADMAQDLQRWLDGQTVKAAQGRQLKTTRPWRLNGAMIFSAAGIGAVGLSLALFNFEVHTLVAELTPFALTGSAQGVVTPVSAEENLPSKASLGSDVEETAIANATESPFEFDQANRDATHHLENLAFDEFDRELDRALQSAMRNNAQAVERYAVKAWRLAEKALETHTDDLVWYENGLDALSILIDCARERGDTKQAQIYAKEHLRLAYTLNRLDPGPATGGELTESLSLTGTIALEAGDMKAASGFFSTAAGRFRQTPPRSVSAKQAFVETCRGMAIVYWRSGKAVEAVQWAAQVEKAVNKLKEDPLLQIDPGFADWASELRADVQPLLAHYHRSNNSNISQERARDVSIFTGNRDSADEDDRYAPESFDPGPPPPHPPHGYQHGPHLPPPPPFHHRPR